MLPTLRLKVPSSKIQAVFALLEPEHQHTMLEQLEADGCTPFQLLVATMLSARTKDVTTIPIVKRLFAQYPTPRDILTLPQTKLEKLIYGIGFYHVKAKHLQNLCRLLLEEHRGVVPLSMEGLLSLPGIGRKTANCLLSYAFHQPAIAVDTHVHRISNRLGWVKTATPKESEQKLQQVVPKSSWTKVNSLLVDHGQRICLPIRPKCGMCAVREFCEFGRRTKQ